MLMFALICFINQVLADIPANSRFDILVALIKISDSSSMVRPLKIDCMILLINRKYSKNLDRADCNSTRLC